MRSSSLDLRLLVVGLVLACMPLVGAAPVAVEPATDVATENAPALDIKELRLDNGLRIFVAERRSSPTFAALYQFNVGSVTDPKGRSGIAHLLEHMMFKGSDTVGVLDREQERPLMKRLTTLWRELHGELDKRDDPFAAADEDRIAALEKEIEEISAAQKKLIVKNEYDEVMTRAGGASMNAMTAADFTLYMIQMPANRLELWFQMESERLLNPVFREFYSERDVVQEERRMRYENQPGGMMRLAQLTLMYAAHPYGTPGIGWPSDLQRLTREDAVDYFRTYYSPSNCTMMLVGDVDLAEVEKLAKKYFGPWQRQEIPRVQITSEVEQQGARRAIVEFDAEPQLLIAWPTVPEGHDDMYALDALGMILGGLWSSRLDQTVVQSERLAARISSGSTTMRYGGYFTARGTLNEGHTTSELEAAIEREIARVVKDGVTDEELERAKISSEVRRVRRLKSNLGQAFRIAGAVRTAGRTSYLEEYERRFAEVTAAEVQAVAAKYLAPARKNVVELEKTASTGAAGRRRGGVTHQRGGSVGARGQAHSVGFGKAMKAVAAAPPVELKMLEIGKDLDRVELDCGVTVFIREDRSAPEVNMRFFWAGGANTTPVEELAPFELANDLFGEGGTEALDPTALQERKDELGMGFGLYAGLTSSGGSFWSLSRNFDESFALAIDMLMRPRFDADRLATIKGQYIEAMRRRYESPGYGNYLIGKHVIDGEHPRLGRVTTRAEIEAVTPAQIKALWKRYFGRDNLHVAVVGDFDKQEMLARLEQTFGKFREAGDKSRKFITRDPVVKPGVFVVEKELAQPAVSVSHQLKVDRTASVKDHAALEILNQILGGSGFRSRLMERLRSDEGLTYGIRSSVYHQGRPGVPGEIDISYQTRKELSAGFRRTTNNRMEMLAAIVGLQTLKEPCQVVLYSDSKYLVDAIRKGWAKKWRANGWMRTKTEKAKNPDLWNLILGLCIRHQVEFVWVRGHAGNPENERCDELACHAADQEDLPPDHAYEAEQSP